MVEIIGAYYVDEQPDASLLELIVHKPFHEITITGFTQEIEGQHFDDWQVPFNEKYLDPQGENIKGDDLVTPTELSRSCRLTLFIYFLDYDKPLITPFGEINLPAKTAAPERITRIIRFEDPE